ncbi:flagellar hook-associated protein [Citrobacter amalonaticus]|uniref:Flagellar hook-associated protein n=1 Tax=Citrobacter amalonaticus TaxID=35703 RepID=A0A2S4RRQ5_CITAM|nr:flagellar hook-associated protein [Citrobacter amalonaticus]POT58649.1 flagellar hook-associated protein [Citrobacter amalonaticus]POT70387.1 flagellar hook-associated protein [Citrobacter amalonaticus]POU61371.1 flagellar hook-associated protein [Citrobacter amalonaticus]POV05061.1 flagellar hook-associated protein [Citrobacter amalonaticus]
MQVGLNTTSLSGSGTLNSSVQQHAVAQNTPVRQKSTATASSDYPASPLIATRPQRYSVQLNDQLTTLQQADHYLGQLEQHLLDYRHTARRGGQAQQQKGSELAAFLEKRPTLSGGAVDRQLKSVLQGEARVSFHSPDLAQRLRDNSTGSRMFSISDGRQTQLSAVVVEEDTQPGQYNMMMSHALRRVGVQMHEGQGEMTFSTTEAQWPQIEKTLSVCSGAEKTLAFTPLKSFADPSRADELLQRVRQGGNRALDGIQQALDTISDQRAQMAVQQEKARQLIDGMARFPQGESAVQASENLGGVLDHANHNYQVLAQAVNGQARLSSQTVRSLLG